MILQLTHGTTMSSQLDEGRTRYAMMTLHDLARQIVVASDPHALVELHQRTAFYPNGTGPVCLADLVDYLRRQAMGRGNEHADEAYDLTIDKFSRLDRKGDQDTASGSAGQQPRRLGMDCRRYFAAFVKYLDEQQATTGWMAALEREMFEGKVLQQLVCRHFHLSLRERHRSAFMTRYVWHLPGGALTLFMPRSISGRARRQWLEQNVKDVDPAQPNEQVRIQAIIDEKIGQPRLFSLSEEGGMDRRHLLAHRALSRGEDPLAISVEGLADTVAREKAANIHQQRPAIRALGEQKLREMIRQIFDGLMDDGYRLVDVAQQYGVSKATLSRFAGIRWDGGQNADLYPVPDLWRNTAGVVGSDPDFVEAAKRAGVWQRIKAVADAHMFVRDQEGKQTP